MPLLYKDLHLTFFVPRKEKKKIPDPKWWYFGLACVLQPSKKASKVFTILSRGFPFEVGVEFYLGVDSSCLSVLGVLLCNEHPRVGWESRLNPRKKACQTVVIHIFFLIA